MNLDTGEATITSVLGPDTEDPTVDEDTSFPRVVFLETASFADTDLFEVVFLGRASLVDTDLFEDLGLGGGRGEDCTNEDLGDGGCVISEIFEPVEEPILLVL